jgi:hypothetical protein
MNIRWIDVSTKHLLLWNGKKAEVHEIVPDISINISKNNLLE